MKMTSHPSVCPHDCPSACALEVERLDDGTIGRVHGSKDNPFTDGVICAKVARYAERVHHPDRLSQPLRRRGPKGSGAFEEITWEQALDDVAEALLTVTDRHGAEAVWPYYYGGTMGLVQSNALARLQRAGGYSELAETLCSKIIKAGWAAGVGTAWGTNQLESRESDLVVFWGTNPVSTQVQAWSHAMAARKENGAKIVTIDPYRTPSAEKSDRHLALRPGTDGALACAVMHVLFAEDMADRAYMARFTDDPERLEAHLRTRDPAWAAEITGLDKDEIVDFARLYGRAKKSYIRVGWGFSRSRNGAVNVHAVSCLPAVSGAWQHRGGGALAMTGGLFDLDTDFIRGEDLSCDARTLDMSRLGDILLGEGLDGGPPVSAMLIQNTNPMVVAPESKKVRRGFARDDLFVCVHEQFMTDTAAYADIVLPATTFLEHDDVYTSYGQSYLQIARKIIEPLGQARSNHAVVGGLAKRLGFTHPAFFLSDSEIVEHLLADEDRTIHATDCIDKSKSFEESHFLKGFGHADGRFRFAPDWQALGPYGARLPALPDHVDLIEVADDAHPYRLVTAPARHFLNSTFNETPTSRRLEGCPKALLNKQDFDSLGLEEGNIVFLENQRASVRVHARSVVGQQKGVVIVEGLWSNGGFQEGLGINSLVGGDPVGPAGGAAFHDTAVRVRPA